MVDEPDISHSGTTEARRPTAADARIGNAIRTRRLELGLRIEDLAKSLSIAPHQLQKYETGSNRITASRLATCAKVLDVSIAWFFQSLDNLTASAVPQPATPIGEQDLVDLFRAMTPEAREQLLGIARLLTKPLPIK